MSTKKGKTGIDKIYLIGGGAALLVVIAIVCIVVALINKEDPVVSGEPYDYAESGNLELGDYKGIEVNVGVTDEDAEAEIEAILEDAELYTQIEGTPVEGDYICISYKAVVDGQEIEDYSGVNEFITVGDEEIEPEFDSAVMTMNTGDTKTVDVTYPESYGDELIDGKTVNYELTVHYIAGDPIKQELTDEFVASYSEGEVTAAADFHEYVKETMYQENVDYVTESAWEIVLENAEVDKYHKGEVKLAEEETIKSYEEFAELTGESILDSFGMTDDDIKEIAKEVALERMVAKTIAAKENLEMSDDKYTETLREYLKYDDDNAELDTMNLEELEKYYIDVYQEEPKETMFLEFVKKFVVDNANIVGLK